MICGERLCSHVHCCAVALCTVQINLYIPFYAKPIFTEYPAVQGRTQGEGSCRAAAPKNQNLKNTDFVAIMISKVLRDLPFSRHQPLKWADELEF
jgi:hypothetical protein